MKYERKQAEKDGKKRHKKISYKRNRNEDNEKQGRGKS